MKTSQSKPHSHSAMTAPESEVMPWQGKRPEDFVSREEFETLKDKMDSLHGALTANTRTTNESNAKSAELLSLYGDLKGWLRIGKAIGDLFDWIVKIAIGLGVVWVVFKYGVQETYKAVTGKG